MVGHRTIDPQRVGISAIIRNEKECNRIDVLQTRTGRPQITRTRGHERIIFEVKARSHRRNIATVVED